MGTTNARRSKGRVTRSSVRRSRRAVKPTPPISEHPLFCVFVKMPDGTEKIMKRFLEPVAAAQYVGGYNSSGVLRGEWAEAREVDLDSIRFVGPLTSKQVFEHVSSFRKNLGTQAVAEKGGDA